MLNRRVVKYAGKMRINFWKKDTTAEVNLVPDPDTFTEGAYEESVATEVRAESHQVAEKAKIYYTIVRWTLYIGAFLLPLFFLPWTSSILELNKQVLLVVVAGVGLITWLLGIVVSGQVSFRANPVDKGVAGLLLATAVAAIFSVSRYHSVFGLSLSLSESLVTVVALSIYYFLVVNVLDDRGRSLRTTLAASLILAVTIGLLQMLTVYLLGFGFAHSRAFNTVGSVNALGLLAAIALPFFSRIRLGFKNVPYLDFAKIGMVVSVLVLIILNWWVLWTVAIIGMLAMISLDSVGMAQEGHGFKVTRFVLPMTIIVLGVFLMIVNFNLNFVKSQLPVEVAPAYGLTGTIINGVFKENLIFGYGPENFILAFDKYGASRLANSTLSSLRFFDSVSQFTNWMIDGGIIMILAVVLFLWAIVEAFIKSRRLIGRGVTENLTAGDFSGTVAALAGAVGALFLYPFGTTAFFVLYILVALLVLAVWGGSRRVMDIEEKPIVSLVASIGFIVGLIAVLSGSYFTAMKYLADAKFATALAAGDSNKAAGKLVQAINWDAKDDRYYRAISQVTLNLLAQDLNKPADPKDAQRAARIQNYIASAINLAKRATEVGPRDSDNWSNLGTVYQNMIGLVDGVEKLAEDAYLKAEEARPGDASFYNQIGSMYLARSDLMRQLSRSAGSNASSFINEANANLSRAEDNFKKAIDLANNYGLAIYNLGAVYDRQNRVDEAIKQLEKIIPFNANQPNLLFELGLLYYRAGRKNDALAALQRAVVISPNYANALWYMALIMEERKNIDVAVSLLNKILETNNGNQVVLDKLAQLEAGKTAIPPEKVIDQKPLESVKTSQ